jgi:hypothetical protein
MEFGFDGLGTRSGMPDIPVMSLHILSHRRTRPATEYEGLK